ncbi:CPBP family intramembrane glutamic endopeptidase [Isosphaeraceae bacterium EP7]
MPTSLLARLASSALTIVLLSMLYGMLTNWASVLKNRGRIGDWLPPRVPLSPPWGGAEVAIAFLAWFLLQNVFAVAYFYLAMRPADGPGLTFNEMIALSTFSNLLIVAFLLDLLRRRAGGTLVGTVMPEEGLMAQVRLGVRTALLMAPVVLALNLGLVKLWQLVAPDQNVHPLAKMMQSDSSPLTLALAFLAATIAAPATEELMFRVILLGWLVRPRHVSAPGDEDVEDPQPTPRPGWLADPATRANLAVSLAFGLIHFGQWPAPVGIFVLSMALGELYLRTGSLVAPFVAHATFNGVSTVALSLALLNTPAGAAKPGPKPAKIPAASAAKEAVERAIPDPLPVTPGVNAESPLKNGDSSDF